MHENGYDEESTVELNMTAQEDRGGEAEEMTQEERENRRLFEENERLRKELERVRELSVKERLYDHVHVSVRTMDIFIGVMIALLVIVVVVGILNK